MTYQEFVDKYNNKGIDFDGAYGYQCMDLAHQYAVEVVGHDFAPAPAAKDVWNQSVDGYDKIANTPDGVPAQGDIIIWGVGVGAYGHIAIFDHGDSNTFTSFDQNWPLNSLCHLQNHNYNGVLGWFHPKSSAILAQPIAQYTDQTKIPAALLNSPDYPVSDDTEVQAIRGWLGDLGKAKQQINDLTSTNSQQASMIADLQKKLKALTDAAPSPTTGPKTYTTQLGKLFARLAESFG